MTMIFTIVKMPIVVKVFRRIIYLGVGTVKEKGSLSQKGVYEGEGASKVVKLSW